MPVLLEEFAVYVIVAAPWQRTEEDPKTKTGTVTDGVMVITCVAVFGPPQPSALTVTVVVAIQPATYVTAPLEAFIVLPPARLAASRENVMLLALAAFAEYVTVPAPWHRVELAPATKTGTPTFAITVTVCVDDLGPPQPAALAVTIDVPTNPAT